MAVNTLNTQDLRDMLKELERVLALHYSDDMDVIRRCCYSADGEPAQVDTHERRQDRHTHTHTHAD